MQPYLPPFVRPDTIDGVTYVGLLPGKAATWVTDYWPNSHQPWSLYSATVQQLDDELLAAAGFADLAGRAPDSVLFSPGVRATFGPRLPA